jgi:hypothetical protein
MTRLALAAVVALVLALSACGGVESEPNLAKAVDRTASGSHRTSMVLTAGGDGFRCDGAADYERHRSRMACSATSSAGSDDYEWRLIEETYYARFGADADALWESESVSGLDAPLDVLSPQRFFAFLRSDISTLERIGEELTRGDETVHYTFTADCDAQGPDCLASTGDAWIDDDGLLRRLRFASPGATIEFEFYDIGAPVEIEPPRADQIRD